MEKSTAWAYGVFSLSSRPQVIAKPPLLIPRGGVTGKEPVGGGSTIGQFLAQVPVGDWLTVGIVFKAEKRADPSTVWMPAALLIAVVSPNEPLRSNVLVMPSPKWS